MPMDNHSFICKWNNPLGKPCFRSAIDGVFCKWHLMENRIILFRNRNKSSQVSSKVLIDAFIVGLLFGVCAKFFYSSWHFFSYLGSQAFFAKEAGHNPSFAILTLGIGLFIFAEFILIFRNFSPPFQETWLSYFLIWIVFLALGIALVFLPSIIDWIPKQLSERIAEVMYFFPICIIVHGIERRIGLISLIIFFIGIGCVFFSGLINILAEFLFRLIGIFDILPNIDPEIRATKSFSLIFIGICYCATAIDILIAICYTGHMVTPFSGNKGLNRNSFRRRRNEGIFVFVIRYFLFFIFIYTVLLGQGLILRHCLGVVLGIYLFDVIPLNVLIYMLLVVALHYFISKKIVSKRDLYSNISSQ
jgi:hypothetical protein